MSELRIEAYRMPAANLGPASPLPPLRSLSRVHSEIQTHESVPEEAKKYLGYGLDAGILPYAIQDDYDRNRKERDFRVAVLENDVLRATFLLELGGRLWSLVHKPTGRELLYRNPVFQPGNLAVRNAWFAGGVEWNCSIQGHTPFTCSPLFAARVEADDGTPILRMYEWERIRGVPFQMDFSLPDGSPWLYARMRVVNPHDVEIPVYWWSNIAVHEREDIRVIVPAEAAFSFSYRGLMSHIPVPVFDGIDRTYPTNYPTAADAFYDLPEGNRPWIAALDKEGSGLLQTSTRRLRGRKLFVWGMGNGGRHWQEFLAEPGSNYIEIQAGLARTQVECIPMPAKADWSWLEAYGLMGADPEAVQGSDWSAARGEVQRRLDDALPENELKKRFAESEAAALRPPTEILQRGSGWGALERRRRERAGLPLPWDDALVFDDDSLSEEQAPWLSLLEQGEIPAGDPSEGPGAWIVQPEWRALLEATLKDGRSDNGRSWLLLGIMRYHAGEAQAAETAWRLSLKRSDSPWALRNLAVSASHQGDKARAAMLWHEAHQMLPGQAQLAIECANALAGAGRYEDVVSLCEAVPDALRENLRLRTIRAGAELELGRLDSVEVFLRGCDQVPDIREGEVSLTDLWFSLQERRLSEAEGVPVDDALKRRARGGFPPPPHIDFRMSE